LAIAIVTPDPASHDTRQYIAIASTVGGASLQGLPDGVTVGVTNLAVAVNKASGTGASPLDWSKDIDLDPDDSSFHSSAVVVGGTTIGFAAHPVLEASGTLTLNLLDFVTATADFAFRQTTVDVNVGPATWDTTATALANRDLAGAQETMLYLSIHDLFAGDPN